MPRRKKPRRSPNLPKYLQADVQPKNEEQANMLDSIRKNTITFVQGYPGTGKTFLAVYEAICGYFREEYTQMVFSRPIVEAGGEKLGYLPGNMYEKIDPYMIPIIDALSQLLEQSVFNQLMGKREYDSPIRILPLAFMRGVTLRHSFCVIDEAQNMSSEQMRMLLTRIGEGSKIVICGDIRQSDVKDRNGLEEVFELLKGIDGIGFVILTKNAIVRHPLIAYIEDRYQQKEDTPND